MEPIFVEIAAGEDIVSTLVNLAQSHQAAGIVVSSGSGAISEVGLSYSASHTPASPVKGSFYMTRLSGTHINVNDDCIPPQFMDTYGRSSFFSMTIMDKILVEL
jgi:predicted DNA-binding protein with PD1-like motif